MKEKKCNIALMFQIIFNSEAQVSISFNDYSTSEEQKKKGNKKTAPTDD